MDKCVGYAIFKSPAYLVISLIDFVFNNDLLIFSILVSSSFGFKIVKYNVFKDIYIFNIYNLQSVIQNNNPV